MNKITLSALNAAHYSTQLSERVASFNASAAELDAKRAELDRIVATCLAKESTHIHLHGGRTSDNGQASWIGANTFRDGGEALARAEELKRQRLQIPIAALRLLDELAAIRDMAQGDWQAHVARLNEALTKATAAAEKEAAKFSGLSDSARQAHVADRTTAERAAVSEASDPCPANWMGWERQHIDEVREVFLSDLRQAFRTAI